MNGLLYIVSIPLRIFFVTIGTIYDVIKIFVTSHFDRSFKYMDEKCRSLAILNDEFGNMACPEFWNDTLIKKESLHKFGVMGQTLSAVIGLNYESCTLTRVGTFINNSLNFFWKNHTINAANDLKNG